MSALHDNEFNDLPHDDEVITRARALFRGACENVDPYHTLRLGLARRKALHAGSGRYSMRAWASVAGAVVACSALAVGVAWMRPDPGDPSRAGAAASTSLPASQPAGIDEIPEVGSSQMDMVQDLDFYRWLATQPAVATAAPGRGS